MSRAYKCDRCGALYESYEGENRDDVLKPTQVMFRCTTKDRHYYDTQFFDLCQKCMKEILEIMNLDEEGEKKSK
jgi:rubredoxin